MWHDVCLLLVCCRILYASSVEYSTTGCFSSIHTWCSGFQPVQLRPFPNRQKFFQEPGSHRPDSTLTCCAHGKLTSLPGRHISISGKYTPFVYGSTLQAMTARSPTTSAKKFSTKPDGNVLDGAMGSTPSAAMMVGPRDALVEGGATVRMQPREETSAYGGAVTVSLVSSCSGGGVGEAKALSEKVGWCCGLQYWPNSSR